MSTVQAVVTGPVSIKLKYPVDINGAKVSEFKMRRPLVNDMLAAEKIGGGDASKEVALFANLCMVSPEDVGRLDYSDYKRLQETWRGFSD